MAPDVVRSRYERMDAFADLATRLDPRGTFRNAFTRRFVFGGEPPGPGPRT